MQPFYFNKPNEVLKFYLICYWLCLLIITFNILGLIPSAQANSTSQHFINVPVNADGSISVKFAKGGTMDVNIANIGGVPLVNSALDCNVIGINSEAIEYPLHVQEEK